MPVIMSKIKPSTCRRLQFDDNDDEDAAERNGQINPDNNDHSAEETADQNFTNACLEDLRLRNRDESSRRWNFDFENETPLEGPFVWERVEPEHDIVTATLVEARVTTIETQQNEQNEAMDCDVAVDASTTAVPPNESSTKSDTLAKEQMTTPTKSSQ